MIDLKDLRENPDKYRQGARLKQVDVDIDAVLALDARRAAAQKEFEQLRAEQNRASAEIGKIKDPEARKTAITRMGDLKQQVKAAEDRAKAAEAELTPLLLRIPQPPDDDVPVGKDASENVVLYRWGEPPKFSFKPKSHIELGEKLGLIDFARGVKLAGTRSYFLVGLGAELHNAVLRLAMDMMVRENGFTALNVPVLVREPAMIGTGFFPAGREQTYQVDPGPEEKFLTGTAEVALTAFHQDEVLDEADLPRKYAAISTCFRLRAGSTC